MAEIVTCPKCGRPRALGHRCPSCGDAPTAADQQAAASDAADSWQQGARQGGTPDTQLFAVQTGPTPARKKSRGRLATVVVATAVIVVAVVVAAVLATGGTAVKKEADSAASAVDTASDLAAQALLRNAMSATDMVAVESGSYQDIMQATLQTMEPGITWIQGSAGLCASPPPGANVKQNTVAWVSTGPMGYELGTWSASGVEFGVRVDQIGQGNTYYRDGEPADW
jgi:hypothetical protein